MFVYPSAQLEDLSANHRRQIISLVRESIDSILHLDQPYQDQVVESYARSLRLTFLSTVFLGCFMVAIVSPLKLPRLENKRS